jgi:hypothetical protein
MGRQANCRHVRQINRKPVSLPELKSLPGVGSQPYPVIITVSADRRRASDQEDRRSDSDEKVTNSPQIK